MVETDDDEDVLHDQEGEVGGKKGMILVDEFKSKLRRVEHELEEKNEVIAELKEILEQSQDTSSKLRNENLELIQEARSARALRDEIDILNERVRKVVLLENEVVKYKEKMNDLDFYKTRLEELREDNRLISESKSVLEQQMENARKKLEKVPSLEAQVIQLKAYANELESQRESDQERINLIMEEVSTLRSEKKSIAEELAQVQSELDQVREQVQSMKSYESLGRDKVPSSINDGSNNAPENLFEQLNVDAAKRILKLELENQKLLSLVDKSSGNQVNSSTTVNTGTSLINMININKRYSIYCTQPNGSSNNNNQHNNNGHGSPGHDDIEDYGDSEEGVFSSPELAMSEADSGCASLVGELNQKLEKMERENVRLKNNLETLKEAEIKIDELEETRVQLQLELRTTRARLESEVSKNDKLERSSACLFRENQRLQQLIDRFQQLHEEQENLQQYYNGHHHHQEQRQHLRQHHHQYDTDCFNEPETLAIEDRPSSSSNSSPARNGTTTSVGVGDHHHHHHMLQRSQSVRIRSPSSPTKTNGHYHHHHHIQMSVNANPANSSTTTMSNGSGYHHHHHVQLRSQRSSSPHPSSSSAATMTNGHHHHVHLHDLHPEPAISPTPSTVGTTSMWYEYGCV